MANPHSNLKKNIGYQTIYQVLITALPLITAPYLARILGASQQGVYSFNNSIVSYFTLFAMLGISNHGTRCIADSGDNIEKRSTAFWNLYALQIVTSIVMCALYSVYLLFFCKENTEIATLFSMAVLACLFDVSWLFFGIEQFKITVTRNGIIRIIVVILILLFVKSQKDLWIYTILMNGSVLVGNVVLVVLAKKYIHYKAPQWKEIIKNFKPVLVLFVPLLAMTFYHVMDKTMLGILSDYENSGFYYNADKVINIPIGIIAGISTVLFPRSVALLNNKTEEGFLDLFSSGVEGTLILSIAMASGIAAISREFTPLFFGSGFDACVGLIILFSPVMVVKSLSTSIRYQYLVPKHLEQYFTYSVLFGAVTNLAANFMLIPSMGAMGAVIGTLLAEIVACVVQIILIRNRINILTPIIRTFPYVFFGLLMIGCVRLIGNILAISLFFKVIIEVLAGAFIFTVTSIVYAFIVKDRTMIYGILKSTINKIKHT